MPVFLEKPFVDFIHFQIATGNPEEIKNGLQRICHAYRSGYRIKDEPDRTGLERLINGVLRTHSDEPKVRRWSLNAIALLGRKETCLESVEDILQKYEHDPETMASAIAAVFKFIPSAQERLIKKMGIDPDLVVLSALQQTPVQEIDLSNTRINIERASPEILKLGLILVGVGKAPQHIFHPRHENGEIVRVLGGHHDEIVSQYSVWAISENSALGLNNLGISIKNIENQKQNVRAWMHRLIAMNADATNPYIEYILLGIDDDQIKVREGLAAGLQNTFFDGLDPCVLDWYVAEPSESVRSNVLDHIVKQSTNCSNYEGFALEFYEKEGAGSPRRMRMEAMAAGTGTYGKLIKLKIEGQSELFENIEYHQYFYGDIDMSNRSVKVGGNVSGIVATGDETKNTINRSLSGDEIVTILREFQSARQIIDEVDVDDRLKSKARNAIDDAEKDPSPGKLERALGVIKKVAEAAKSVTKSVKSLLGIIKAVTEIVYKINST